MTEAGLRSQWELSKPHAPAQDAASRSLAPVLQEAKFVLLGVRLGKMVRVHGVIAAADETVAARLEKAAEAARELELKRLPEEVAAAKDREDRAQARRCNAVWVPIYTAMRFSRDGVTVRMESLVPAAAIAKGLAAIAADEKASKPGQPIGPAAPKPVPPGAKVAARNGQ
jgi:hypothetical protein